jgi:hypothetical protein
MPTVAPSSPVANPSCDRLAASPPAHRQAPLDADEPSQRNTSGRCKVPRAPMQSLDEWTEVLAALSLATDLANGHDYEKTLRSCVLAEGLAEAMGLSEEQRRDVFHATLVRFIGCTSFAHEEAVLFGDDIAARHAFATVDHRDKGQLWRASGEAMLGLGPRIEPR